jgi:hypothetical protein
MAFGLVGKQLGDVRQKNCALVHFSPEHFTPEYCELERRTQEPDVAIAYRLKPLTQLLLSFAKTSALGS